MCIETNPQRIYYTTDGLYIQHSQERRNSKLLTFEINLEYKQVTQLQSPHNCKKDIKNKTIIKNYLYNLLFEKISETMDILNLQDRINLKNDKDIIISKLWDTF